MQQERDVMLDCEQQWKHDDRLRFVGCCVKRQSDEASRQAFQASVQALRGGTESKHGRSSPTFTAKKSTCLFGANDGSGHVLRCVPACSPMLGWCMDRWLDRASPPANDREEMKLGEEDRGKQGETALEPQPVPFINQ